MTLISTTELWRRLEQHADRLGKRPLAELLAEPDRFQQFTVRAGDLLYDFSKQRLDGSALRDLLALCELRDLAGWRERLFRGDPVNSSEGRPALHTALRAPGDDGARVDGQPVHADVAASLEKMEAIVGKIHAGQWRGCSGKAITDVVNLGVGGSDLGPLMACHALEEFRAPGARRLGIHFVSSIDGSQLAELLERLNPETTLFIFSSKSFTTIDTLANAEAAKRWLGSCCNDERTLIRRHFVGCSANPEKMTAWGIPEQNQLRFWNWVGGRFSLWSAIGLPIALLIGMERFRDFLAGGHAMDRHFRTAPAEQNLPVLMALIGIWNHNFLRTRGHAVLPYDGRMKFFPNYLTQLEMESNGKSVDREGNPLDYDTCPIIWGDVGPNAQHAFYQLLHQGTEPVSCDFLAPVRRYRHLPPGRTRSQLEDQQRLTLANCLAQSRVLALGSSALAEDDPRRGSRRDQFYRGNQPSSTLLYPELCPRTLGQLVALYEHKVFVQAVIWNINPFDQWGVELGKVLAQDTYRALLGEAEVPDDPSTRGLFDHIMQLQKED